MSDNENKAAVGRGIEMVNEAVRFRQEHPDDAAGIQRNIEAIVARHLNHMGDGYTNTSPRTGLWTEAGFPDRQFTIDEQIAEGGTPSGHATRCAAHTSASGRVTHPRGKNSA